MSARKSYPLSSIDVVVCIGKKRYHMAQSNGVELRCSGLAGWGVWRHEEDGTQTRIASESEGNCGEFRIEIAGVPIFGKSQSAKPKHHTVLCTDDPLQVLASLVRAIPGDHSLRVSAALRAAELAACIGELDVLNPPRSLS